ncbi:MAG: hypothetical protein WCJ36_02495 [Candidatus Saccharibacteria bacterium]
MTKQKKKRNKVYAGADAAITKPIITRISAVNRSKVGQWWFDRKKSLKPILITAGVVVFVIVLIVEIVRIASGSI